MEGLPPPMLPMFDTLINRKSLIMWCSSVTRHKEGNSGTDDDRSVIRGNRTTEKFHISYDTFNDQVVARHGGFAFLLSLYEIAIMAT